jgi:hypothetical protein
MCRWDLLCSRRIKRWFSSCIFIVSDKSAVDEMTGLMAVEQEQYPDDQSPDDDILLPAALARAIATMAT